MVVMVRLSSSLLSKLQPTKMTTSNPNSDMLPSPTSATILLCAPMVNGESTALLPSTMKPKTATR